jgi:hypothetical protein
MRAAVVDTNVLIVANEGSEQATPECVLASVNALSALRRSGLVALDDQFLILDEYRSHASLGGQPGVGDGFLRHLYDNLYNGAVCRVVTITRIEDGSFVEFPSDQRLATFDRDDRKFVAVALCCEPIAEILNATDTDWWNHQEALAVNGIDVRFLCPDLMGPKPVR